MEEFQNFHIKTKLLISLFFFFRKCATQLKELQQRGRERGRKRHRDKKRHLRSIVSHPGWLPQPELDQCEARSKEPAASSGFPVWVHGPNHVAILVCSPRPQEGAGREVEQEVDHAPMDYQHHRHRFTCYATKPAPAFTSLQASNVITSNNCSFSMKLSF